MAKFTPSGTSGDTEEAGGAPPPAAEGVSVTTLRDEPPAGAPALAVTTFVRLNAQAPAQSREAWLAAFAAWWAGRPSSISTPKAARKE